MNVVVYELCVVCESSYTPDGKVCEECREAARWADDGGPVLDSGVQGRTPEMESA